MLLAIPGLALFFHACGFKGAEREYLLNGEERSGKWTSGQVKTGAWRKN